MKVTWLEHTIQNSSVAGTPVKFRSNRTSPKTNLREILWWEVGFYRVPVAIIVSIHSMYNFTIFTSCAIPKEPIWFNLYRFISCLDISIKMSLLVIEPAYSENKVNTFGLPMPYIQHQFKSIFESHSESLFKAALPGLIHLWPIAGNTMYNMSI